MRPICWVIPALSPSRPPIAWCDSGVDRRLYGQPDFYGEHHAGFLSARAFAGVVIGGFGNIKGAIIGSLFVGIVEAFST